MAEKYCICNGEAKGFMILCDVCEKWFHGSCVKLKRSSNLPEKWFCKQCSALWMRVEQLFNKEKEERIKKTDAVVRLFKQENEKLNALWNIEKDTIKRLENKCDQLSKDVQQIFLAKEACKHNSQTDSLNSIAVVKFLKEENKKLSACLHEEKIKVNCMENKCHQLIEEKEEIYMQSQMGANKAAVTLQSLQEETKNVRACLNRERERIQNFERKCQQLIIKEKDTAQQMVQTEHSNDTAETQMLREENGTLSASLKNERERNEQLVQENKILKEQVALLRKRKRLSLSQN
ncbi:Set1 complex component spp1 [Frankliniella fusca]|uniref:Set1 complex component spp1 n=1 Tax=Frankliniella fusca TaxID=407009 RepID=A0AAE1HQ37_9NEOP|nr:Set1 complex component spp1 [Frankliniella fusca]KAK3924675.1 Set1 complex component spp1 [Frankliniella fusca]